MKYSKMIECLNKLVANKSLKVEGIDISSKMQSAIELWSLMYKNEQPWLGKEESSSGVPASVAAEIARLVTLELKSEVSGTSERSQKVNKVYQSVLSDIRKQVEYGCALGSMVFKPYPSCKTVAIQYNAADSFYPISFDSNGNIVQSAFTEQFKRGREIYTRVELHSLVNGTVEIDNFAFVSKTGANIGNEIPLNSVSRWQDIEPHAILQGADRLMIGYFMVPFANNIDSDSPLGVSVYSRAVEHIKIADKRYNQIDWEYDAKEAAVHVASSMLKYNKDLDKFEYPAGKKRLYRTVEYENGATDKPFMDTYSPDIRDQSYINGYNQELRRIEFDCGLAYGTLSDVQTTDKTAEEIKASKQRSYANVSDVQQKLQKALEDLVVAIDYWFAVIDGGLIEKQEVSFEWDDSIVVDSDRERQQDRNDLAIGAMTLEEYIVKWRGKTPEEAKAIAASHADIIDGTGGDI